MAQKLDSTSRAQALGQLMALGWGMVDGRDAIVITLKFKDFSQAWAAMTRIALLAEAMDHHPEWANVYNRLTVTLTTHSCDGLSDLDITLAQAISDIAQQQGGMVLKG